MANELVTDAEGNPLDYFVFSISEKIGLPNYSSIDLFASLGRHVADTDDARQDVIETVESVLAKERQLVLENLSLNA